MDDRTKLKIHATGWWLVLASGILGATGIGIIIAPALCIAGVFMIAATRNVN